MPVSPQTSGGLRAEGGIATVEAKLFGVVAIIRLVPVIPVEAIGTTYLSIAHDFSPK